jgi:hypothetical protein
MQMCVKSPRASRMVVGVWLVLERVSEAYSVESLYSDGYSIYIKSDRLDL